MNLQGFRDYATDDGEDYWHVGISHALEAVVGEMASWPVVRTLNLTTGEIKEGSLMYLLDTISEAARAGHTLRIEPLPAEEKK